MRIRVRVTGAGTLADALRTPLPTCNMVDIDYARALALVDIPDADVPDNPGLRVALQAVQDLPTAAQGPLAPPLEQAWYDHLDRRYSERAGQPRPQRR